MQTVPISWTETTPIAVAVKPYWVKTEVLPGEALAYHTAEGWAFSGHYFHQWEGDSLVTRESFASGAVRFEKHNPKDWAVIRGTNTLALV